MKTLEVHPVNASLPAFLKRMRKDAESRGAVALTASQALHLAGDIETLIKDFSALVKANKDVVMLPRKIEIRDVW